MPGWVLKDMPSTGSLYSLIETIPPDVVSHRIDGGGMYAGTAARIGAHGSSWTQTLFRVGDINISSPTGSGTPLALPGVLEWDSVDVNTGIVGIEANTAGMVVNLSPRRPSSTWLRQVELSGGPPAFQLGNADAPPPAIARLNTFGNASLLLSGPLRERLGLVFAGTYTRAARFERDSPAVLDGSIGSAFAHLVYTVSPRDEVRTVLWGQWSTTPVEHSLIFAATVRTGERDVALAADHLGAARHGRGTVVARIRGDVITRPIAEDRAARRLVDRAPVRRATMGADLPGARHRARVADRRNDEAGAVGMVQSPA